MVGNANPENPTRSRTVADILALTNAELRRRLSDVRREWATLQTERQKRLVEFRWEIDEEEYKAIGEKYNRLRTELVSRKTRHILDDTKLTNDECRREIVREALKEQDELRKLTIEDLQGEKVSKYAEWVNKGKNKARTAKYLAIGAIAGIVGANIGDAPGVATGLLLFGLSRPDKAYVLYNECGMGTVEERLGISDENRIAHGIDTKITDPNSFDEVVEIIVRQTDDLFEEHIKGEQANRRKYILKNLGKAAVGGFIGRAVF